MKDLTVFYQTYEAMLRQGKPWSDAMREAEWAQGSFDKYIAQQAEASKLKPVDAETAMQNITDSIDPHFFVKVNDVQKDTGGIAKTITVPLSTFHEEEQPEKLYWKPVEQFSKEDAFFDRADFLLTKVANGTIDSFTMGYDMTERGATHYLAHCKEDKGEFVPSSEWSELDSNNIAVSALDKDLNVLYGNAHGWFYVYKRAYSLPYPTLEAAKHEAERYYRLYIEPTFAK